MLTIRLEKSSDATAREALLDAAYGPVRFEKPSMLDEDLPEPAPRDSPHARRQTRANDVCIDQERS